MKIKRSIMPPTILQFMNYQPIVYSGFDKFSIALADRMQRDGCRSIMVYTDTMQHAPLLGNDLAGAELTVELIPEGGSAIAQFRRVYQLFKKYRPTLVHAHFSDRLKVVVALCARRFGVPLITTIHTEITPVHTVNDYRAEKGWIKTLLFRNYFRFLALNSKLVFCVSQNVRDKFVRYTGCKANVKVLYLGVEAAKSEETSASIRKRLGLSPDKILIGNVSAIQEIKGLDTIMVALHRLRTEYGQQNFVFCHIGGHRSGSQSSDYADLLLQQIAEFDLSEHVKWLGVRTDVLDILPAFDIYTQPSRLEGLPVSVMEACSCSLPCVGSSVSGNPEIIHHGENGYLMSVNDDEALAAYFNELIDDEQKRGEMGAKSYKIFKENFMLSTQVERTAEYYAKFI